LARALGRVPGSFLIGDIRKLWSRGAGDNRPCRCGLPFLACPFWTEVGREAFGGWDRLDHRRVDALATRVTSARMVGKLLVGMPDPCFGQYRGVVGRVVAAVIRLTGAQPIVVYAKHPYEGLILGRLADASVRWVHVVRDPREIAWLWTIGPVEMKDDEWLPMTTAGIVYRWGRYNVIPPLVSRLGGVPYCRVRFEDLTREPAATLDGVWRFAGAPSEGARMATGGHDLIALDRDTGPCRLVELELREERGAAAWLLERSPWREELPGAARAAITTATFPLMAAFGYLRRGALSPPSRQQ
jgi:hypothetical protein